jgi:spore germination cell wall hydrolase CwlJ-like protein
MTDRDTDVLARTVCGEARGEGEAGMSDVACVVMNRVRAA